MKKWNWEKIAWSWPVMLLNACCFVFMICVGAKSCAEGREREERKAAEKRREEIQYIIKELKKDSL